MDEPPQKTERAMSEPRQGDDEREGYVAIDYGSVATRVCIVITKTNPTTGKREVVDHQYVQENRAKHDPSIRFERGEYPSRGCPFDGPPFHVGFDATNQSSKRVVSLKGIPYFRTQTNANEPFTEALYSHYEALPSDKAKEDFNQTLDQMLSVFFKSVVGPVIARSESKTSGFKLRSLVLCIPNTWSARDNKIQAYLSPIFDKTVEGRGVETLFMFEAQAMAQFMMHRYPQLLKGYDHLIALDFGGHSMGGSDGVLKWADDNRPRIFSPPEGEFGVGGGYELWEALIGQSLDEAREKRRKGPDKFPDEQWPFVRAGLLEQFFLKKTSTDYKNERRLRVELDEIPGCTGSGKAASYNERLTGDQVSDAWESAFRKAIKMAQDNIERVAKKYKKKNKNVLVLISGGSIENIRARDEITGFCSKFRLRGTSTRIDCKHVSDDIDVMSTKWLIAEGAARCQAATMDVEKFFDRGGVLACVMASYVSTKTAKLLFWKKPECGPHGENFDVKFTLAGDKMPRLVANPAFISQPQKGTNKVFIDDCYDIWDMPRHYKPAKEADTLSEMPKGKYKLDVAYIDYAGADAELVLRLRPDVPKRRKKAVARRSERLVKSRSPLDEEQSLLLKVPLTSNGSSNLVELDLDRIQDRVWMFKEDLEPSDSEYDESQVEDSDSDAPLAKRLRIGGIA